MGGLLVVEFGGGGRGMLELAGGGGHIGSEREVVRMVLGW